MLTRTIWLFAACMTLCFGCESPKGPPTVRSVEDIVFEEGKDAGRAGLSRDLCPYPPAEQKSGWYIAESGERRIKWLSGHNTGTIEREDAK